MKKIDKAVADAYYKKRVRNIAVYLSIWFVVSFGAVFMAESLSQFTFNGMPFHYFMGAQGALIVFVILLFTNAIQSDKIDREFGIDEIENERLGSGKALDH